MFRSKVSNLVGYDRVVRLLGPTKRMTQESTSSVYCQNAFLYCLLITKYLLYKFKLVSETLKNKYVFVNFRTTINQ